MRALIICILSFDSIEVSTIEIRDSPKQSRSSTDSIVVSVILKSIHFEACSRSARISFELIEADVLSGLRPTLSFELSIDISRIYELRASGTIGDLDRSVEMVFLFSSILFDNGGFVRDLDGELDGDTFFATEGVDVTPFFPWLFFPLFRFFVQRTSMPVSADNSQFVVFLPTEFLFVFFPSEFLTFANSFLFKESFDESGLLFFFFDDDFCFFIFFLMARRSSRAFNFK
mmetsp:Transcript_16343/g.23049  ORF Transcript_16343/g.23049 Transcript_16343/m.23049 type:complete len:230 (+) Transcript_16343:698-1387(+)